MGQRGTKATLGGYRRVITSVATAGLLLSACAGSDDGADTAAAAATEAGAPVSADGGAADGVATGTEGGGDDVDGAAVEVVLRDFSFDGLPGTVPAGTRLTVINGAERELHELVAFRLPDDEDRSVADLARLSPPELMAALGEPATVLLAEPGGPTIPAVGDGTLTEPGRYAVMCFIPTGIDPATYLEAAAASEDGPPDVGGGPPHFVHGMHAELTVE